LNFASTGQFRWPDPVIATPGIGLATVTGPEQSIRFASVGGRRLAWAAVGDGPPLLMGGWWMSHLELDWAQPRFQAFVGALAEHRRVVRYDRPGTGLAADGDRPSTELADEVRALAAVADEIGTGPVAMFAGSAGGPVVAAYAAENPTRVDRAVFYGSYARGSGIADAASREAMVNLVRSHWGLGSRVLSDVFMPTATGAEREAFVRFQREAGDAENAARSLAAVYSFDVVDALARIEVPTLVLHRRDDRAIPFALGQDFAALVPGATFQALDGSDHLPWYGDAGAVARATLEFLGVSNPVVALGDDGPAGPAVEHDLSERELEVLRLVALGLSDKEIAERLVLSPHTVHRHVANVRTKLRLPSRAAAAAHAARMGLI
jgi:pimeloyl-ACP methyl ester carboxylesterase/DNA-binding CsgD family transcriptional regulator